VKLVRCVKQILQDVVCRWFCCRLKTCNLGVTYNGRSKESMGCISLAMAIVAGVAVNMLNSVMFGIFVPIDRKLFQ
jgi:hypothetical protein